MAAPEAKPIVRIRDIRDSEVSQYRDHGAVHLPALVDSETCARLLSAADVRRANPSELASDNVPGGKFWEERDSHRYSAAFRAFVLESRMGELAAKVLGSRQVAFYFDHLFMLEADTAKNEYYWHQDRPYWACEGSQICSFWLALTDCTVNSGALELVLGTDRLSEQRKAAFGSDNLASIGEESLNLAADTLPPYHEHRDRYTIVSWDIKAGDAILFNSMIAHSSRGNHSRTQRRVAYSTRWVGDDAIFRVKPGYMDPVTLPGDLKDGDFLTKSSKYPVVWPSN